MKISKIFSKKNEKIFNFFAKFDEKDIKNSQKHPINSHLLKIIKNFEKNACKAFGNAYSNVFRKGTQTARLGELREPHRLSVVRGNSRCPWAVRPERSDASKESKEIKTLEA